MAGWDFRNEMSNNAVLAIKCGGMIPFVALTADEKDRLWALDDDAYDAATAPHHVLIDEKVYYVPFVEAEVVGREPMTVEEIAEHLTVVWDQGSLEYKVAWK